jgi:hypothetical protein
MSMYSVDCKNASTHIPLHPERTAYAQTTTFCVYYHEFSTRASMERWYKRLSWADKQTWSCWMSSPRNRQLIAQRDGRKSDSIPVTLLHEQQSLTFEGVC